MLIDKNDETARILYTEEQIELLNTLYMSRQMLKSGLALLYPEKEKIEKHIAKGELLDAQICEEANGIINAGCARVNALQDTVILKNPNMTGFNMQCECEVRRAA